MKYIIHLFIQNIPYISFWIFIILLVLTLIGMFYFLYNLVLAFSYLDKSEERNIFDMQFMSEEEQKLHSFTLLNTKINREQSGNSDYYVNESNKFYNLYLLVYKRIYGTNYKYPPISRNKVNKVKRKVTFADRPIILNEEEFF